MTGSAINFLMGSSKQMAPAVGMGATQLCWTDRHAFTIIAVKGAKKIVVQRDIPQRVDNNGMSESQSYLFLPDPEGVTETVTLRKNGRWITEGQGMKNGEAWLIGHRREYYDYSF